VGDVPLRLDLLSQDELNHLARVSERFEETGSGPHAGLSPGSFLEAELVQLAARCERTSIPLSCLALSVDQFSELRDAHGERLRRSVLQGVARLTALAVRDDDPCVAGGEDMVFVVLPGSTAQSAGEVADRIRRIVAGHDWARDAARLLVTTSIGVATRAPAEKLEDWIARAVRAARIAADSGRNRVEQARLIPVAARPIIRPPARIIRPLSGGNETEV
jgi:two-component system cell cycle response regulator